MVGLVGLVQLDLPGPVTVRLTDGGVFSWGGNTFASRDDLLGAISAIEASPEGIGEEVPAITLSFQPPQESTPSDLAQPGWQQARVRVWLGEYDRAAGTITGDPDCLFDGQLDQCVFTVGASQRELEITVVSTAERLFDRNSPSALSPVAHKTFWPGETGNDNATGLTRQVAWGIEAPPGTNGSGSTAAASAPGLGRSFWNGVITNAVV